jgi:hypothetical protein
MRETESESVHCTELAQDRDKYLALVNTAMNLQIS